MANYFTPCSVGTIGMGLNPHRDAYLSGKKDLWREMDFPHGLSLTLPSFL